jgi:endonuclease/exonuclease/phosphatase family metal-dependent hydrolase
VATYNLAGLKFGVEVAAAALLQAAAGPPPDVALLQECGSRTNLRHFARLIGGETVSTHRLFNRVRNAVLFRPPWRISGTPIIRDLPSNGATYPRGFIVAPLQADGLQLHAVSAHLGLVAEERRKHAIELTESVTGLEGSMVLGADLNEGPRGPVVRIITDRVGEAFHTSGYAPGNTFPADRPRARIDFLFASPDVRVLRAWVGQGPVVMRGSDHVPVLAEMEIARG